MYLINLYRRWRLSRRLKKAIEADRVRKNAPLVKRRITPKTSIQK